MKFNVFTLIFTAIAFSGCVSHRPSPVATSFPELPPLAIVARSSVVVPPPNIPRNVTVSVAPPAVFTLVRASELIGACQFVTNANGSVTMPADMQAAFFRAVETNLVAVAWDIPTASDIQGIKIYAGLASRAYDLIQDVGLTNRWTILARQGTNYFSAVTYDSSGAESAFSNEASWVIEPFTVTIR